MEFKKLHSFEKRKAEAQRILDKYPERIPVVVTINPKEKDLPKLDKNKYLVPGDITVGAFLYIVRKRLKIGPEKGVFMFFNDVLQPTSKLMREIYEEEKDDDLFLYCSIAGQNTFGTSFGK